MTMVEQIEKHERIWGVMCHLLTIPGIIIPFCNIITPFLIWITKKKNSQFIDHHGKESVNFQITFTIIWIFCPLVAFLIGINEIVLFAGCIILFFLAMFYFMQIISSCFLANKGNFNRYPFALRLIK